MVAVNVIVDSQDQLANKKYVLIVNLIQNAIKIQENVYAKLVMNLSIINVGKNAKMIVTIMDVINTYL